MGDEEGEKQYQFVTQIYIPKRSKDSKQACNGINSNTIKVGDIVSEVDDEGYITSGENVLVVEEIDPSSGKAFIVNTHQLGIWTPTKTLRKAPIQPWHRKKYSVKE